MRSMPVLMATSQGSMLLLSARRSRRGQPTRSGWGGGGGEGDTRPSIRSKSIVLLFFDGVRWLSGCWCTWFISCVKC